MLDYLNAPAVTRELVPHEVRRIGSREVTITRQISPDGRYVTKEIHLMDEGRSFLERVRLFAPDELALMLRDAGFAVRERLGDYDGGRLRAESPRAIFLAERR